MSTKRRLGTRPLDKHRSIGKIERFNRTLADDFLYA